MLAVDLLPIDLPGSGGEWQVDSAQHALPVQSALPVSAADAGLPADASQPGPVSSALPEALGDPGTVAVGAEPDERDVLAALEGGLAQMTAWAADFDQQSTLQLPLVTGAASQLSSGELLSSSTLFRENLWIPLQTYLSGGSAVSLEGFVDVLRRQAAVESASLDQLADEYVFKLRLAATHTSSATLDLETHALTEGFRLPGPVSVGLTTQASVQLSCGISLRDPTITREDFFLRAPTIALSVASDQKQTLDFDLGFGFLALQVNDAHLDMAADLTARVGNPDGDDQGDLSFDDLASAPVAFEVAISRPAQAILPVDADFLPFAVAPRVVTIVHGARPSIDPDIANTQQKAGEALAGGLAKLADWAGTLDERELLATPLPLVDSSLASLVRLADFWRSGLADPVRDALKAPELSSASPDKPLNASAETLKAALERLKQTGTVVEADYDPRGEYGFSLSLAGERLARRTLDLADLVAGSALTLASLRPLTGASGAEVSDVEVVSRFAAALRFGVDLAKLPSTDEAFFVELGGAQLSAALAADFNAGGRFGMLELSVPGGHAALEANLVLTPASGDKKRFTAGELVGASLGEIAALAPGSSSLRVNLPLQATLGGFSYSDPAGQPGLTLTDASLFDGERPILDYSALFSDQLQGFAELTAPDLVGALQQLPDWLSGLAATPIFGDRLPLIGGVQMGDVLGQADALRARLEGLLADPDRPAAGLSDVQTAQEIVRRLALPRDSVNYDPATRELSFALSFSGTKQSTGELSLGKELGPLSSMASSQAEVTLNAAASGALSLGVLLTPLGGGFSLTPETRLSALNGGRGIDLSVGCEAANAAPTDGRLTADLSFDLLLDTFDAQPVRVPLRLTKAATDDNTSVLDLVSDLNALLGSALASRGFPPVTEQRLPAVEVSASAAAGANLVFAANDRRINALTINAGQALGFAGTQSGDRTDLRLKLRSGDELAVDLDGAETLADVLARINGAAAGAVLARLAADQAAIVVTDATQGEHAFSINGLDASFAALWLGLAGVDEDGDGVIHGRALHGDSIADHVFVAGDATLEASVALAAEVNASANFAFVGIDIAHGALSGTATASFALADYQSMIDGNDDGRMTLREMFAGLEVATKSDASLPHVEFGGSLTLDLPVQLDADLPGLAIPADAKLQMALPDLAQAALITADLAQLGDLAALDGMSFAALSDGVAKVLALVQGIERLPAIDFSLPVMNVKLNDAVNFAARLASFDSALRLAAVANLQALEAKIEDLSGVSDDAVGLNWLADEKLLRLDLRFAHQAAPATQRLQIAVSDALGELVDAGGQAELALTAGADFQLALGFKAGSSPQVFLYDDSTKLSLLVHAAASAMNFDAALGPLGIFIRDGHLSLARSKEDALAPAEFLVGFGTSNGRHELTGDLSAVLDDLLASGSGYVDLELPVFFPTAGSLLTTLDFEQDLGSLGGSPVVDTRSGLAAAIADKVSSADLGVLLGGLAQGWDGLSAALSSALQGDSLFGRKLPLIGNALQDKSAFVEDIRQRVAEKLKALAGSAVNETQVRDALFAALGSSGWLRDRNDDADTTIDENDIVVRQVVEAGATVGFEFDLHLGQAVRIEQAGGLDLGLPSLGLELSGGVSAELAVSWHLGIGVTRSAGVYMASWADENEIQLGLTVTPTLSATATLGFLQVDVEDDAQHPSRFIGEFKLDIADPDGDGRVTLADLAGGAALDLFVPLADQVSGTAEVHLDLSASFGGNTHFPSIDADFDLTWQLGGNLELGLNNIRLDLGEFVQDYAAPALARVEQVIAPVLPVIRMLSRPLPVISDLIGEQLSLLDLARAFGVSSPVVDQIVGVASDIAGLLSALPTTGDAELALGSFKLPTTSAANLAANFAQLVANASFVPHAQTSGQASPLIASSGASTFGGWLAELKKLEKYGLSFNLLQPRSAFELLLGGNPPLFVYDPPALEVGFSYSQSFRIPPIPVLKVEIGGRLFARADFAFGFDTTGLRQFAEGGFDEPSLIANGFFVSDWKNGIDVPEVQLGGSLTAGASLDVLIAKAGVEGGIYASVDFNLHDGDGDGLIRAGEIADSFALGPIHVFDVSGKLEAGLRAYYKVNLLFKKISKTYRLADVTLLDFQIERPKPAEPPPLATLAQGVLSLSATDGDDSRTLTRGSDDHEVIVSAPKRAAQTFSGVDRIVWSAGKGNDSASVSADIVLPVEFHGGAGNDVLQGGGASDILVGDEGNDRIYGQDGADTLNGDAGEDLLYGQGGADVVQGGDGNDTLDGGSAADTVSGGLGADVLYGGAGNDLIHAASSAGEVDEVAHIIHGGSGDDTIYGSSWVDDDSEASNNPLNDVIYGDGKEGEEETPVAASDGNDKIYSADGDDLVYGGGGRDTLCGEGGNDALNGQSGDDVLDGGDGNDQLLGDQGNDRLSGASGDDSLEGGAGSDTLDGGSGDDQIFGHDALRATADDSASDQLYGDAGNDVLTGGLGADTVLGGADNDTLYGADAESSGDEAGNTMHGGSGDDEIFGGAGNDSIWGDGQNDAQGTSDDARDGADTIHAGDGDDNVLAGGAADRVWGAGGSDTIYGEAGNDTIHAGDGRDEVSGGDANDQLSGGAEDDWMLGDAGDDTLSGDDGSDVLWGDAVAVLGGAALGVEDFAATDSANFQRPANYSAVLLLSPGVVWTTSAASWKVPARLGGLSVEASSVGADVLIGGGDAAGDFLFGGGGVDRLFGGGGADYLDAGSGNDPAIEGGAGDDVILAGAGNDTINAGDDADWIVAGSGDDLIRGGSGNEVIFADAGNDTLYAGDAAYGRAGADLHLILGGDDQDVIYGDNGDDTVLGGLGGDAVFTFAGDDLIYALDTSSAVDVQAHRLDGGDGNDTIYGSGGADLIHGDNPQATGGSDGDDRILAGAGNDTVDAGGGNDWIAAGVGQDEVFGLAGNDVIYAVDETFGEDAYAHTLVGGEGNDTIHGSSGDDHIVGDTPGSSSLEDGDDDLFGYAGNDTLLGGAGDDWLVGGFGADQLAAGAGSNVLWGDRAGLLAGTGVTLARGDFPFNAAPVSFGAIFAVADDQRDGSDTLSGGLEVDYLFAGGRSDTLYGGDGNDYLDAGSGSDAVVYGEGGNDFMRGGADDDTLRGGSGIDQLYGDGGSDRLYGEAGVEAGAGRHDLSGQKLFGGAGTDYLYAYAPTSGLAETELVGDQLFGGDDADFLYGNLRQETLDGGSGNDFIAGDHLAGAYELRNPNADTAGGADLLFGGDGDDRILGGGGVDTLWGGAGSDWLEGQDRADVLYGGEGIDLLKLDTAARHTEFGETIDGHHGNSQAGDALDDKAVDILLIEGSDANDVISLAQGPGGQMNVGYNGRSIAVNWLAGTTPLIEQIRVSGLAGNDEIGFSEGAQALAPRGLGQAGADFFGVLDGGPGNDTLRGSMARDRLDGGAGSDTLYGLDGDDRLWGDAGDGSPADHDVLYGGKGDDDLLGGSGTNDLYAWSRDPRNADGSFGVFDGTEWESTGLNRVLGGPQADQLYGGSGLDFLYGNGGSDTLYRADGSELSSLVGGLGAGDDAAWKDYAQSTGKVWYRAATALDDVITVDYVTTGKYARHHTISIGTETSSGNMFGIYFGDFEVGKEGNVLDLVRLQDDVRTAIEAGQGLPAVAAYRGSFLTVLQDILPEERDFAAIIIDALGGDDTVTVGSTVQKSVWVDAGSGDDDVHIESGFALLADQTDSEWRNDDRNHAFSLCSASSGEATITASSAFTGLTIDSGDDVDWYRFSLSQTANASLVVKSDQSLADFTVEVSNAASSSKIDVPVVPLVGPDAVDLLAARNESRTAAYDLPAIERIGLLRGLSLDSVVDRDWFRLALPDVQTSDPAAVTLRRTAGASATISLDVLGAGGVPLRSAVVSKTQAEKTLSLHGLTAGEYFLRLTAADDGGPGNYELAFDIGADHGRQLIDLSGAGGQLVSLGSLQTNTPYLLKLATNRVPGGYALSFDLADGKTPVEVDLATRADATRRDVVLGGADNDRLSGGSGEDWIFGGDGDDLLSGGKDKQAADLLFGGAGDDAFQLVPDGLPIVAGPSQTAFPTIADRFDGGSGTDTVLYYGGDTGQNSAEFVADYVALRYNTHLHRYELTSLQWDNQTSAAGDGAYLHDGSVPRQDYVFYQPVNVERTLIQTRGGDDEVYANPGHLIPGSSSGLWGFNPGDLAQGALLAALEIDGGDGDDTLYGGPLGDTINGGAGGDTIFGGGGDDLLYGEGGSDTIYGYAPEGSASGSLVTTTTRIDVYEHLLAPLPGTWVGTGVAGIDLSAPRPGPSLQQSFVLQGRAEDEQLGRAINIGDFNGDGADDLLLAGEKEACVLFGPVDFGQFSRAELTLAADVAQHIVSLEALGKPASQMGDINGDGFGDLVFFKNLTPPQGGSAHEGVVSILFGRNADATQLPRRVEDGGSVDRRILLSNPAYAVDLQEAVVLNWDGDVNPETGLPYLDVLVIDPARRFPSTSVERGFAFVYPGKALSAHDLNDQSYAARLVDSSTSIYEAYRGATVAGDVNGDGLDDLLIQVSDSPGYNRVHLLAGRATPWEDLEAEERAVIDIEHQSQAIWEDDYLAAGVRIGDLTGDGLAEIGLLRELGAGSSYPPYDQEYTGGLYVIPGSDRFSVHSAPGAAHHPDTDAAWVVVRTPGEGVRQIAGPLAATTGDFNGDREIDLAIGMPFASVVKADNSVEWRDRGELFVVWSVAERAREIDLGNADVSFIGALEGPGFYDGDRLGAFLPPSSLDIDGDHLDDLLIGSPWSDKGSITNAGTIYAVYGSRTRSALPTAATALVNRSISGSGSFLVDDGTGSATIFRGTTVADLRYQLPAGDRLGAWYSFTTLGDGASDNDLQVRVWQPELGFALPPANSACGRSYQIGGELAQSLTLSFDIAELMRFRDDPAEMGAVKLRLPLSSIVGSGALSMQLVADPDELKDFELRPGDPAVEIDVTRSVQKTLADGGTRLSIRLRPVGALAGMPLVKLADPALVGGRGFIPDVTSDGAGVVADLFDARGGLLAEGRSLISLRALSAGTYFLRVYDPAPTPATHPLAFEIAVRAPAPGHTHESARQPDRDIIFGGEGSDFRLAGNDDLDWLFGGDGSDTLLGEDLEICDAIGGDIRLDPGTIPDSQLSRLSRSDADPVVRIPDRALAAAIARTLELPIDRPIYASDMASLRRLDAEGLGIRSGVGLAYAVNLKSLNLAHNALTDLEFLLPGKDARDESIGLQNLAHLSVDFNRLTALPASAELAQLSALRSLSLDGNAIADPSALASLPHLELLSLDKQRHADGTYALATLAGFRSGFARLQVLSLADNDIDDVKPIVAIETLQLLDLRGNAIHDIGPLAGEWTSDDGDPGMRLFGDHWLGNVNPVVGAYGEDYRFVHVGAAGDQASAAQWTFPELPDGDYQVLATWPAADSRSESVRYTVATIEPLVDSSSAGFTLFREVPAPLYPASPGGRTVEINTDTRTIVGDDVSVADDAGKFYGVDFSAWESGGTVYFDLRGDLHIAADTLRCTGARAASIRVSGDILIDPGAIFDASGFGAQAGAGGGQGGAGGIVQMSTIGGVFSYITLDAQNGRAGVNNPAGGGEGGKGSQAEGGEGGRNEVSGYVLSGGGGGGGGGGGAPGTAGASGGGGGGGIALLASGRLVIGAASGFKVSGGDGGDNTHGQGDGGGGGGGSVQLGASALTASTLTVDAAGGAVGASQVLPATPGGSGRLLLASNVPVDRTGWTVDAVAEHFAGPLASNPFVAQSPMTPRLPGSLADASGLRGQPEAYGLLDRSARQLFSDAFLARAGAAAAVLVRVDLGPVGFDYDFPGYDLLLFANLTTDLSIDDARMGVGRAGYLHYLADSPDGMDVHLALAPGDVFATLIPSAAESFAVDGWINGLHAAAESPALANGQALLMHVGTLARPVNQAAPPSSAGEGALRWQELASATVAAGSTGSGVKVALTAATPGLVAADAIRLRALQPVLPVLDRLLLEANPLDNRSHEIAAEVFLGRSSLTPDLHAPLIEPLITESNGVPLAVIALSASDADDDPIVFTAESDNARVQAFILPGDELRLATEPGFVGSARITVRAHDGPHFDGDWRGRSSQVAFDYHAGGSSAIYGSKYDDLNRNGLRDPGEPGLEGVAISLVTAQGAFPLATTYTDVNGDYVLRDLVFGSEADEFAVVEQPPGNQIPVYTASRTIIGQRGQIIRGVDFGNLVVVDAGDNRVISEGDRLILTGTYLPIDAGLRYASSLHNPDGTVCLVESTDLVRQFAPLDDGVYTFKVVAYDSLGEWRYEDKAYIVVNNDPPTLVLDGAAGTLAGVPYRLSLNATDVGADTIRQWEIDWGDGNRQTVSGNPSHVDHVYRADYGRSGADLTIAVSATDDDGRYAASPFALSIDPNLMVSRLEPTTSGFRLRFNRAIDAAPINLYDAADLARGATDVSLRKGTANVRGSLVMDADLQGFTFIKTGGVLDAGSYEVRLESGTNRFSDGSSALDGNQDGYRGDPYLGGFTVGSTPANTLGVGDFMRGPGQPVNLPATGSGLPVFINSSGGLSSISFVMDYDPALLRVTGVLPATGLPAQMQLVRSDVSQPGRVEVTLVGSAPLPAGKVNLVCLLAQVPTTAPYAAKHVLDFVQVVINGSAADHSDDDGLHLVGYFGDASGNANYHSLDAQRVQRVASNLDSGFSAYPTVDPRVVADLSGDGLLSAVDAARLQNVVLGRRDPAIPARPAVGSITFSGPDPKVWVAVGDHAAIGEMLTATVELDTAEGLESVRLRLAYDVEALQLLTVRRGELTNDFGWFVDRSSPGLVDVDMSRLQRMQSGSGDLLRLAFRVIGGHGERLALDLVEAWLNEGRLTLNVQPRLGEDATDGHLTVVSPPAMDATRTHTITQAGLPPAVDLSARWDGSRLDNVHFKEEEERKAKKSSKPARAPSGWQEQSAGGGTRSAAPGQNRKIRIDLTKR